MGLRWQAMVELSFDLASFYNNYDKLRSYDIGTPSMQSIDSQPFLPT